MAKIVFYDATALDQEQLSRELSVSDHHWTFVEERISLENLDPGAEVISVFVSSTVTSEMIEKMPNLKLIACRSTGFNNIDFEAAAKHDITIVNVPTYGEHTVAEFAFTMLLALTRKLENVIDAETERVKPEQLTGIDLHGKTIGVIGTGHIGQKTISIAHGFSMRALAYDVHRDDELASKVGFEYVELDDLLKQSDVVSLHVPLLPSTHHLLDARRIARMKKGAILLNTARGELVDSKALIEYLDNGHLGGAGIDVVEGETLLNMQDEISIVLGRINPRGTMNHSVEISILKGMDNVIISPHNAYNTVEAIGRINSTTAENIMKFWFNDVPNKVEPPKKPIGKLVIARHTESEWNATGKWTGVTDVHLSEKGFKQAAKLGLQLKDLGIEFDVAYCSEQIRARETIEGMLNASQQFDVNIIRDGAINERDYGDFTGKNKWEMKDTLGEDRFNKIRRGWDEDIPNGETLKRVYERTLPFYKETILPQLREGKNILIVAHGNSIRSLMKYIESINDTDVENLEMLLGQIVVYDVDDEGKMTNSQLAQIDMEPTKA